MENNQELESECTSDSVDEVDGTSVVGQEAAEDNKPDQPRRYSKFRKLLIPIVVVLGMISILVWYAIYQAQQIPEFYAAVLELDDAQAKIQGRMFERNLLRLQNASRRPRPWKVEFKQEQINGWFSSDLPEKFPEAIPRSISDPRVVFTDKEIKLGFKYSFRGATGYVVLNADVFCTDKPNEIAIKVRDAKTGFISLPIGPWLERVANSIRNAGIPVFWSRNSGMPVAIFTLPESITSVEAKNVVVESISLNSEKLTISGKTVRIELVPQEKSTD